MKLILRSLLAPLWLPFYFLYLLMYNLPVFIIWLASDETWEDSEHLCWSNADNGY